ncbi:hypothetical protein PPYR_06739 [Photinus pyralis]|uniref:Uncharacterized protein n=1 Tax=Photinus pyralis TaxID=7054 RepID=A0A5N4ANF1_PHOPY|nr:hypothetical protein PPYR_06739 [Photinus pyralis]
MSKNVKSDAARKLSVGSIEEFLFKRKREEEEGKGQVAEKFDAFKKSKVMQRTPPTASKTEKQTDNKATSMERLEQLITAMTLQMQEVKEEIKEEIKSARSDIRSTNEQMKRYGEEIRILNEELKKKEAEWQSERQELRQEINQLKKRLDTQDKNTKKNNIVIKGSTLQGNNMKEQVKEFIEEQIGIKVEVECRNSV